MNQKHLLTLLVMAAMASASLFGCLQAFRYNRSMQDSLLATDIEALADDESGSTHSTESNQKMKWDPSEPIPCDSGSNGSGEVSGGFRYYSIDAGGSGSHYYHGYMVLCNGSYDAKYYVCSQVDCFGKITMIGSY